MSYHSNKKSVMAALVAASLLAGGLAGCGKASHQELRDQARQYQQHADYGAATIVLKNVLAADPDDAEARFLLARLYVETGDALAAEKEARRALKLGYRQDAARVVLGKALLLQSQFQKVLDELGQHGAADVELACVRADAYLGLGQRDAARQLYGEVLQLHPRHAGALIGLGRTAFMDGELAQAGDYASRALASEPRSTDALLFLGDLQRAQNRPDQALASYDKVLEINPAHRSAHVEKAYLDIGLERYAAAQAELDAAVKATPGSLLVAYTQALLDFSQGKSAAAQESLLKVLRVAPEHMPSVLLAGAVSLNLESPYLAEHHFRHYLEKHPDNAYARKMLASALLRSGHAPDALAALEPALKSPGQDVQLLALAGESHMQARDFGKASEFFARASELNPQAADLRTSLAMSELGKGERNQALANLQLATRLDGKSQKAGMALVRTELDLGNVENAYKAVLELEHAQPRSAPVQDLKGVVQAARRELPEARASFAQALRLQPGYFPASANLARLELNDNKPDKAGQHLQDFLARNPGSVDAMTALASLANGERKSEAATRWLEKASAIDPNAIAPAVNLIAQYLQVKQTERALNLALKLHVTHPDNPNLLDLLGKSQLASGAQQDALATYKKLAITLPRSAQAQMQVAALLILEKSPAEAEEYLKTALAMQPDFPAAELALAELYVRKGWHGLALMIAGRLEKQYPAATAGYQLEGDILMGQNKPALAQAAYTQALARGQTSELVVKHANALRVAGQKDEAAARLAGWTRQHPDDVRVPLFRAEAMMADGQNQDAAAQFEAILKRQPGNVAALNNLALAYQEARDERAQQAAEQAYKVAGEQPVVMDTLGWILVERGDVPRGLAILQKAGAHAPQARDIRYHIAAAQFKAGNKAAARKELEGLMAGDMRFAQADQVRALFRQVQ
jgi:putative PEP-CTERM system TPR-repeat lipoprotein